MAHGMSVRRTYGFSSKEDGTFSDSDDGGGASEFDMVDADGDNTTKAGDRYQYFNRPGGVGLEASVGAVEVVTLITSGNPAKLKVKRRGNACRPRQGDVAKIY